MKKSDKNFPMKSPKISGYETILSEVAGLLESARRASVRATNTIMTATYWEIGRRIVEFEQRGGARAEYGKELLSRLSADLTARFGKGFSVDNLETMRLFYRAYSSLDIKDETSSLPPKSETVSRKFTAVDFTGRFPLPWSHYVLLVRRTKTPEGRAFYEAEALRGGWSVRQLDRQISTQFYERTALSRNKAAMLKKGAKALPEDTVTPEEEIKDPFVLRKTTQLPIMPLKVCRIRFLQPNTVLLYQMRKHWWQRSKRLAECWKDRE